MTVGKAIRERLMLACLVFTFGGIAGFVYEEIFYRIDLGYFVKRGSGFGPWIMIYAIGGVLILLATERVKRSPWKVFWVSLVLCGALELGMGLFLHRALGVRLWDYNVEIWNWGNVGGYICLRSVLLFGLAGVFLRAAVVPRMERFIARAKPRTALLASVVPAAVSALDMLVGFLR